MPNTLIREGYLDSDRVSALSDFDDRVFFRILLAADDAGRTDGRADRLRSILFPTRDTVRSSDVEKAVGRLCDAGLVTRWTWETKPVVQVMRWQRRSGTLHSKFPGPDGSFKISWATVETKDGKQSFSVTSLSSQNRGVAQPIDNPFGGVSPKPTYTDTDTKTDTEEECDGPSALETLSDCSEVLLSFPVNGPGGPTWACRKSLCDEMSLLYGGVDVIPEFRRALAWILANPGRKKTAAGMRRFLANWLSRAQENGHLAQKSKPAERVWRADN